MWGSDYPHHDATFPGAVESYAKSSRRSRRRSGRRCSVATPPRATTCRRHEAASVVGSYFAAIGPRDVEAIRDVFHDRCRPLAARGLGVTAGRDAIAAFYRDAAFQFADLEPRPGPLVVDGNRVAVEIALRMNGTTTAVADVFEVDADGIRRLAVYLGRRPRSIPAAACRVSDRPPPRGLSGRRLD